jgi:hypothetical protein
MKDEWMDGVSMMFSFIDTSGEDEEDKVVI